AGRAPIHLGPRRARPARTRRGAWTPVTIPPDLRAREFAALDAAGIYLNSASIGPMPRRALDVLHAANADRAAPLDWPMSRLDGILGGARERAARLVGTGPATIAPTPNTTT